MSVTVIPLGRLGNNMFQYALGRIIAEHHGFGYSFRPPVQRATPPRGTLADFSGSFPKAGFDLPGELYEYPVESYVIAKDPEWKGNIIDLNAILANRGRRCIRLSGYFQRYEYFAPHRETLRSWFKCHTAPCLHSNISSKDIVVTVRRGVDFGIHDWLLPYSFYNTILSSLNDLGKVFVCGVDIDRAFRRKLAIYNPIYVEGTPPEHFAFLQRFNRIILANSTFCWWAAFLSDATELYAPLSSTKHAYAFRGFNDVDLHMREARYREIEFSHTAHLLFDCCDEKRFVKPEPDGVSLNRRLADGSIVSMHFGEKDTAFVAWLTSVDRHFTVSECKAHYEGAALDAVIGDLIKRGFVVPRAEVLDCGTS